MTLNETREIEARLTDEQASVYDRLLNGSPDYGHFNYLWHASAEQKITALARILRPLVAPEEQR